MNPPGLRRADFDAVDLREAVADGVGDAAADEFSDLIRTVVAEGENEKRSGR